MTTRIKTIFGTDLKQLITNPRNFTRQTDIIEDSEDKDIALIVDYFKQLVKGLGGYADCPYAGAPLYSNSIFARKITPEFLNNFSLVEKSMSYDFNMAHDSLEIEESDYDHFDSTIVIYHFGETYKDNAELCSRIDDFKENANSIFRTKGRMLTQGHLRHPSIPGKAIGFNSINPMLVMKRMNLADEMIVSQDLVSRNSFNSRFKKPDLQG